MPDIYDTTLTVPLTVASTLITDRTAGHRMTMQLWDQIEAVPHRGARASVGCQWTVTDVDLTTATATVLVRSTTAPTRNARWATTQTTLPTHVPGESETVTLRTTIAAMYTPNSDVPVEWRALLKAGADGTPRPPGQGLSYHNRRIAVPTDRLQSWAQAKIERLGLTGTATATPTPAIRIKGELIHTATITIEGTTGGTALRDALRHGIGSAKSYGLGLVTINP
jgi:hypothetical protein